MAIPHVCCYDFPLTKTKCAIVLRNACHSIVNFFTLAKKKDHSKNYNKVLLINEQRVSC